MQEIRQYHYRAAIHKAVPNVRILDDEAFLVEKVGGQLVIRDPPESHRAKKVPDHLRTDWQLVSEGIKAINIDEQEDSASRCLFGQYLYQCGQLPGTFKLLYMFWPSHYHYTRHIL